MQENGNKTQSASGQMQASVTDANEQAPGRLRRARQPVRRAGVTATVPVAHLALLVVLFIDPTLNAGVVRPLQGQRRQTEMLQAKKKQACKLL